MAMLTAWVVFPIVLVVLCLGCGLLLQAIAASKLPGPLLPPAGFASMVVLTGLLTSRGETASLATTAAVLAGLTGFLIALRARARRDGGRKPFDRWVLAAALGVFAVYAAPVVLSGHPTFAGYIKLDDTATWMAFLDRLMEHGRDLSGLEPSSYRATLEANLPNGYPVGAFLPLGVVSRLTGTDVAWLVQPYMATLAALLSLCLYWLVTPLLDSRPLRALVAFGGAQSALLFGYSLWGGIKEVAVALAIALVAALAPAAARAEPGWRPLAPLAIAVTALLAMVGSGGLVWIAPILGLVALAIWRHEGLRSLAQRAVPIALLVALLGIPLLFAAGVFSPTQGGLTDGAELGNLVGPLSVFQYAGIWPSGDFRLDPAAPLTAILVALAIAAAVAGAVLAWRKRAWELLLYAGATAVGTLAVFVYSSPWVGAKALASGSPSFLLLALAGAAALAAGARRAIGGVVLGLLLAGVLWSNALGYHDVSLAPYDQLRELESIGEEISGDGPALMTEYQPYGVRHFLREADAEGASELRIRSIPLRGGGELEKGDWADTDEIASEALLTYRTLVLRRSPAQSRPPAVYSLVRRGDYYDVWQRPESSADAIAGHLSLGDFEDPGAVPICPEVQVLAALAGDGGTLAAARRGPVEVASLAGAARSEGWTPTAPGSPDVIPHGAGSLAINVEIPRAGRYDLYLQGSVRNRLHLAIDGEEAGSVQGQLNPARQFLYFGDVKLHAGIHEATLILEGQGLSPGSGGPPEPIGPLVFSSSMNEDPPVHLVPADQARSLCTQRLDWVEALKPPLPDTLREGS
jgi:hypothetical protein